ncbi:MAG TPA: MBL fold metallo-hydrolase [Candidatus Limnocylindrales bacterium]|nr:MBL fold metallo-hydrolase [Candidatus Limnocylindrales bacterium]
MIPSPVRTLGRFQLHCLSDGHWRMDGGAVFGVVPKVMWEKLKTPDARNRITMATNCMLVRTPDANVLIEAGIGPKLSDKERDIYAYERDPGLPDALRSLGLTEQDIDLVVLSHLHFDHCGALVTPARDGELAPLFPRARHVVQRVELEAWRHPDPRSKPSYKPENLQLLEAAGRLQVVDGDTEVAPGIQVRVTGGHTRGHQAVYVRDQEQTVVFTGDFLFMPAFLKINWVSALDLFPLESMERKAAFLREASRERQLIWFYHETEHRLGYWTEQGFEPV